MMTRILVISDTHGNLTRLQDLVLNCPSIDYYLHLGDSQTPEDLLNPFVTVKGNCDFSFMFRPSRTIKTPHGEIYMSHINTFATEDFNYRNETIFLHGHTHVANVVQLPNNKFLVNPGSLDRPRDGSNGTYLIIEWTSSIITFKICEYGTSNVLIKSFNV